MNNELRQRSAIEETGVGDEAGDGSTLAVERAETDRLFSVAAESFKAMSQGDSREFLRRSRQTGGQ